MSLNAFAIMLKPFLAKYLEPLEEDGTIAKLQADVTLVAQSDIIPSLAALVGHLERHNDLLEQVKNLLEDLKESQNGIAVELEPGSDPDATRLDGDNRDGVPNVSGTD